MTTNEPDDDRWNWPRTVATVFFWACIVIMCAMCTYAVGGRT